MQLILTRHGETRANALYIAEGHSPGVLSPAGYTQHNLTSTCLKEYNLDIIVSSPLHRAQHLAHSVYSHFSQRGIPLLFNSGLQEGDMGIFEGTPLQDVDWSHPSIESLESKLQRAQSVLTTYCNENAFKEDDSQIIYFSTHGGMIKAYYYLFTGTHSDEKILNASITIVSVPRPGKYKIETFNNVDHLKITDEQSRRFRLTL